MNTLLWGNALPMVVGHIVSSALNNGKQETFHDAAQQLRGIRLFIMCNNLGQGCASDALIRLSNEQTRMECMSKDHDLRKSILDRIS